MKQKPKLKLIPKGTPSDLHYSQVRPIIPTPACAWWVKYADGSIEVVICDKFMTVEEVVKMVKVYSDQDFTLRSLTTGTFVIKRVLGAFSGDGRSVNQDLMVGLGG